VGGLTRVGPRAPAPWARERQPKYARQDRIEGRLACFDSDTKKAAREETALAHAPVQADLAQIHAPEAALSALVVALGPDQVAELVALAQASDQPATNPAQHQASPPAQEPASDHPARDQASAAGQRVSPLPAQGFASGRLVAVFQASATASAPRLRLPSAWLPP
jgi:hypothetical protein